MFWLAKHRQHHLNHLRSLINIMYHRKQYSGCIFLITSQPKTAIMSSHKQYYVYKINNKPDLTHTQTHARIIGRKINISYTYPERHTTERTPLTVDIHVNIALACSSHVLLYEQFIQPKNYNFQPSNNYIGTQNTDINYRIG